MDISKCRWITASPVSRDDDPGREKFLYHWFSMHSLIPQSKLHWGEPGQWTGFYADEGPDSIDGAEMKDAPPIGFLMMMIVFHKPGAIYMWCFRRGKFVLVCDRSAHGITNPDELKRYAETLLRMQSIKELRDG